MQAIVNNFIIKHIDHYGTIHYKVLAKELKSIHDVKMGSEALRRRVDNVLRENNITLNQSNNN